jgi:phage terminase large subunit-like protein
VRGPRSDLYDALESAMGAHDHRLSIVISTQAPTDADLLSTLIDDARTSVDSATRLFLHAADPDDDPFDEETWRKANPALGDFRSLDEMREAAERARRLPASEAALRNLYLNQRVAAEDHFLSPGVWALNAGEPDLSLFEDGRPVYGGLDLSSRLDLTALVLVCVDDGGVHHVWPHFWAPGDGVHERARRDRVPYDLWRDCGQLAATPGRTVDYGWVATRLGDLAAACNLVQVRYDRFRIDDLRRELEAAGVAVPLEAHGQGFKDMSPALDRLEAEAINGRLRHGDHPILKWNAANAVVTPDAAGNRKLDKARATGRIDGLVALAMALSAVGAAEPETGTETSVYELLARQQAAEAGHV